MPFQPLAHVRVVTLALNLPGPLAAARLRGMGASVTKVEPPWGDPLKEYAPGWYAALHRGVPVETLELKREKGRARLDPLLEEAGLVLTAMRPSTRRRLGIDFATLAARFPGLAGVAIVGDGDNPEAPGHDLTYQAAAGLVDPPRLPRTLLADLMAAERAVSAALALLLARERGGAPGEARVSLRAAAEACAAPLRHGLTGEGALLGGGDEGYGVYRARDGWVAVAVLEPHFRERLGEALEELGEDAGDLTHAFAGRTGAWWEAWARARDLPLVAVEEGG